MALTSVNRDHHHASGFDQAKDLDRARHSKLMGIAPRVTELTFDRSNSVTQPTARPRKKALCAGLREEQAGVRSCQPQWRLVSLSGPTERSAYLSAFLH